MYQNRILPYLLLFSLFQQQALQPAAAVVAHNQGPPRDAQQPPAISFIGQILLQLTHDGVTIPKTPGILFDLNAVAVAFVCSLFPEWTVR